jgi:hypothetical protein
MQSYPHGLARDLAGHITAFSLGGLTHLAAGTRRQRHAPQRAR